MTRRTVQTFKHDTLGDVKYVDKAEGTPSKKARAADIEIITGQGIGKMDIPALRVLIAQDINKGRIADTIGVGTKGRGKHG